MTVRLSVNPPAVAAKASIIEIFCSRGRARVHGQAKSRILKILRDLHGKERGAEAEQKWELGGVIFPRCSPQHL